MGVKVNAVQLTGCDDADSVGRDASPDSSISWLESRRRKKAVDFARASVELEGFQITEEIEIRAHRFVSGETNLAEFVSSDQSCKVMKE
ncbi:antitoxin VbhA family protein [Paraburkholderia sediminicola]|uniref:antitoxin VbhA family protein n=1 Tax=Paraburkholderia sediminicola TaxID=458836 RepID=UPI0038B868D6